MSESAESREAEALRLLGVHFGIAAHYDDIWGTRRDVARENIVSLLTEFGVRLDGEGAAESALDRTRRRVWQQSLPPVVAIRASESEWSIPFRLPTTVRDIHWQLTEENGARHQGERDVHSFPELTRAELDGIAWCERRVRFGLRLSEGYHRLTVDGFLGETLVVSAPESCYRPGALHDGGRIWGPAVQLYSLRSKRNWGMGDFTDLSRLIKVMAERGADLIGLNPLHALFPHNPGQVSPYSPSSRQHLNPLYIDVEAAGDFAACEAAKRVVFSAAFQARLARLRESALVDHEGVAAAKFEILELLFSHFREQHLLEDGFRARDQRGQAFLSFVAERGEPLRRHALFDALQAHFHPADPLVWGPPVWPDGYRDSGSTDVEAFAEEHSDRVQYHQYLQWLASVQLRRASAQAKALGMRVGLYLDLAVSVDRAGSDSWGEPAGFAKNASVGAPPDQFNPNGQDWGLPPLLPDRMRENRYRFFIETLRANMRDAGALRIDHVMGLMRLFWIPAGKTANDGAYVNYRLDEILAIVALESQRHRCLVIGEDLGTVADEMRAALARFDVLSYRVLYFERQDSGAFKPPEDYPERAVVAIGTHDLPPFPGWWAGRDLRVRRDLGLFPSPEEFEKQILDRAQERVLLMQAVQRAGLLSVQETTESLGAEVLPRRIVEGLHAFLARAPSAVMMVQLEDSLGVTDQINVPGTTNEQPNWRRKMTVDLQGLSTDPQLQGVTHRLALERPRSVSGQPLSQRDRDLGASRHLPDSAS